MQMKDALPHLPDESFQRYRGESLEELRPSSKNITARLYHPPKLRDWMEVTCKNPIWWNDIICKIILSTQGYKWGEREEKVNHLNSLENSIMLLKENMTQCEHDLGSVTSGFLY